MIAPLAKHVFIEPDPTRRGRRRRFARIRNVPARLTGRGARREDSGLPV